LQRCIAALKHVVRAGVFGRVPMHTAFDRTAARQVAPSAPTACTEVEDSAKSPTASVIILMTPLLMRQSRLVKFTHCAAMMRPRLQLPTAVTQSGKIYVKARERDSNLHCQANYSDDPIQQQTQPHHHTRQAKRQYRGGQHLVSNPLYQ